jgi:hypothetical protein
MQTMVLPQGERLSFTGHADDRRIPEGSCRLEIQRNPPHGAWVEVTLSPEETQKLVGWLRRCLGLPAGGAATESFVFWGTVSPHERGRGPRRAQP